MQICSVMAVLSLVLPVVPAADRPPNFVLIFADDLGYGDLSCFGSSEIRTPNIDRLAGEGRRFTDFCVPVALCTPSRAALMTGCYPIRVGLGRGVLRPDETRGLSSDEVTVAELLKRHGYATCCIGKWHLGFCPPFRPGNQGFDYYFGVYHNLDRWEVAPFGVRGVPLLRNETVVRQPADRHQLVKQYTHEACEFIRKQAAEPFLLYLPHTMPHVPLGASAEFQGRSKGGWYGDVVEEIDWGVGQITNTLRALGLAENTIVIFTSDNGPSPLATGSAAPLSGRKHTVLEGGLRVPCVMWGPGRIPAGTVCEELATTMDLLPTFAALAGAELQADRPIDGKDISGLVLGEAGARSPHEWFYGYHGSGQLRAVRSGRWKLHLSYPLQSGKRSRERLYDLEDDIAESRDLRDDQPEVAARLRNQAAAFDRRIRREARAIGTYNGSERAIGLEAARP